MNGRDPPNTPKSVRLDYLATRRLCSQPGVFEQEGFFGVIFSEPRNVSGFRKDVRKKPRFMFSRGFTKLISQGQFSKNTKFRCSRVPVKVLCIIIKVLQGYGTTVSAGHLLKPENSVRLHRNIKNWQSNLQRSFKAGKYTCKEFSRNFPGIFTHWHCAVHR